MNYTYRIYDINFETSFPCPFFPLAPPYSTIDVVVAEGSVPLHLESPLLCETGWDASPGIFLVRGGRRAGRFLIENGTHITLYRAHSAEDEVLAVCFTATVIPMLLQQRGMLVLHANTAMTPRGAVAISGESGAGKTTTVAALLNKECLLVSDDITVLRIKSDNHFEVLPGIQQLHLCEDTAEYFGFDISELPRYPWRRMKVAFPAHTIMVDKPVPLISIYLLSINNSDEFKIHQLTGAEKFAALQECMYGPILPSELSNYFELFSKVINSIDIFRISRPAERWSLDEIVLAITR